MLPNKFREYRTRAGFTQQLMAQFLDIRTQDGSYSKDGYVEYERMKNYSQPPFDTKLAGFARRMMVNLNWMADVEGAAMWSAELLRPLRAAVRRWIREMPRHDEHTGRICSLLRFTHKFDPECFDPLILSAACGRGLEDVQRILAGEDVATGHPTPDYLAEFWEINPAWLLTGEEPPYVVDPNHRVTLIHILDEYGISNETVTDNIAILADLQKARAPVN